MLLSFPHLVLELVHELLTIGGRWLSSLGLIKLLLKVSSSILVLLGFPHLLLKLVHELLAISTRRLTRFSFIKLLL